MQIYKQPDGWTGRQTDIYINIHTYIRTYAPSKQEHRSPLVHQLRRKRQQLRERKEEVVQKVDQIKRMRKDMKVKVYASLFERVRECLCGECWPVYVDGYVHVDLRAYARRRIHVWVWMLKWK